MFQVSRYRLYLLLIYYYYYYLISKFNCNQKQSTLETSKQTRKKACDHSMNNPDSLIKAAPSHLKGTNTRQKPLTNHLRLPSNPKVELPAGFGAIGGRRGERKRGYMKMREHVVMMVMVMMMMRIMMANILLLRARPASRRLLYGYMNL